MKILMIFLLLCSTISAADFSVEFDGDSSITTESSTMSLYGTITNNSDEALKIVVIKNSVEPNFTTVVCVSGKCYMPMQDTIKAIVPADTTVELKVNVDCFEDCTGIVDVTVEDYDNPEDSKSLAFSFTKGEVVAVADKKVVENLEMKAYPNPFNPTTNIAFNMPISSKASVKVYDIRGSQVATLVNGYITQGSHIASFNASKLPSGVYFAKLTYGSVIKTQKLVLVK